MIKKSLVLFFLLFSVLSYAHEIKKIVSIYYIEEVINEVTFIYQIHKMNETTKKTWLVNGEHVDENDYYSKLGDAKAQEWITERKEENEKQARRQEEMQNLKNDIEKQGVKLKIKSAVRSIERTLEEFSGKDLEEYYVFDTDSISSKEQLELLTESLEKAKEVLKKSLDELELEKLQEFQKLFIVWPARLQRFFFESARNAVSTCRNTKDLKKYLGLIS